MSNVLQDIFKDYYEKMISTLHPRNSVIENIDRIINVQHRHCVFTIDSELRHFFLEDSHMSVDDLLDVDYFLNEDVPFGEDFPIKKQKIRYTNPWIHITYSYFYFLFVTDYFYYF